jgi:hypothetical protein
VTSWDRRLHATTSRAITTVERPDELAGAREAGVNEDGIAALAALAGLARQRPGFGTVVDVMGEHDGVLATHRFAVTHGAEGAIVRRIGSGDRTEVMRSTSIEEVHPGLAAGLAARYVHANRSWHREGHPGNEGAGRAE